MPSKKRQWRPFTKSQQKSTEKGKSTARPALSSESSVNGSDMKSRPPKWSMGVLNDKITDEVPGMVIPYIN